MILSYVTELFFQIERVEVLSCQSKPEGTNIHINGFELEWGSMGGAVCIALKDATNQVVISKLF